MKYIVSVFVILFGIQPTNAQELLTLEKAKEIALNNNYTIQISKQNLQQIANNSMLIKAGRKPNFSFNAGLNGNLSNSIFKLYSAPAEAQLWLAPSMSSNVSVAGSYLLWDGHSIDQRVQQNEATIKQATLGLAATNADILYQLESVYYNLLKLQEQEALLKESIDISNKRKLRAQYAFEYGQSNRLELLNANVDLNRDSLNYIRFQQQLVNLKRNLNLLLNRDIHIDFTLEQLNGLEATTSASLEQYLSLSNAHNLDVLQAQEALNIASFDKRINNAALKPRVSANASYGVNYSNNTNASFIDYSLNDGLNLGLSASWTLGDGGRTKILNQNADLNLQQQALLLDQIKDRTQMEVTNVWGDYQNALLLFTLEQSNVATAKENFDRTQEQFTQGLINSITFRQAQLNLLNAQLSLATAKYDAIQLLLDLKLLSGELK